METAVLDVVLFLEQINMVPGTCYIVTDLVSVCFFSTKTNRQKYPKPLALLSQRTYTDIVYILENCPLYLANCKKHVSD